MKKQLLSVCVALLCAGVSARAVEVCLGVFPGNDSKESVAGILGMDPSLLSEIAYVDGSSGSDGGLNVLGISGAVGSEVLDWSWSGAGAEDMLAIAFKLGNEHIVCTFEGSPFPNGNYQIDLRSFDPAFSVNPNNIVAGLSHARAYGAPGVPEPSSILASLAVLGLGVAGRRRLFAKQ
jgi:hypothetical protein